MDPHNTPQNPYVRSLRHSRQFDEAGSSKAPQAQNWSHTPSFGNWQQSKNTDLGLTDAVPLMAAPPGLTTSERQGLENEIASHGRTLQVLQNEFQMRTAAQRELRECHELAAKRDAEHNQCWQDLCHVRVWNMQLTKEVESLKAQLSLSNMLGGHSKKVHSQRSLSLRLTKAQVEHIRQNSESLGFTGDDEDAASEPGSSENNFSAAGVLPVDEL
ncbi:MAG: hypothetical protein M1821_008361 [Bathelium mastoideum]|nr:MAG: hypothetical protein M1821_008361 [Bathelium mastoideum]